jgi:hypothetical protein
MDRGAGLASVGKAPDRVMDPAIAGRRRRIDPLRRDALRLQLAGLLEDGAPFGV